MKRLDRIFHFVETRSSFDRALTKILAIAFCASLIASIGYFSASRSVAIPERGGALVEGVVGAPRFINPILAVTAADRDMTTLLFSGLMRLSEEGIIAPDLAESVTVSDDGLTYNIVLRQGLKFHDGSELAADDVIFTIERIQDPALKSPLRANWEGVSIERLGDHELNLVLAQPYAPFLENLTIGVIPKRIWEFATAEEFPFSQYNSEPVGSGPYMIERIVRNRSGLPESYILKGFGDYHKGAPQIEQLAIRFFQNESALEAALKEGTAASAASLSPEAIGRLMADSTFKDTHELYRAPLPRTFALFFNQNEAPIFRDLAVRRALEAAVDRERMVAIVLGGYGAPIDGPLPKGFGIDDEFIAATGTLSRVESARDILRKGGWKMDEETLRWEKQDGDETMTLSFSIATANAPLFEEAAHLLQESWNELGIPVDVRRYEQSDLTQTVIRPRKYETLLFGTAIGRELDFYSFWHSSQRNDPGLNIALYANITTDSILAELRAGGTIDRPNAYARFASEMKNDLPAIFLFVPEFTYVVPKHIKNVTLTGIASPSERMSRIETWYADEESVWPIFMQ